MKVKEQIRIIRYNPEMLMHIDAHHSNLWSWFMYFYVLANMEAILLKVKHVKLRIRLRMRMRMKKIQKIQRTRLHKLTQHSANRTARTEGVQDVSICFGTSDITNIHWHLIIQASSEHLHQLWPPRLVSDVWLFDLELMDGCGTKTFNHWISAKCCSLQ